VRGIISGLEDGGTGTGVVRKRGSACVCVIGGRAAVKAEERLGG